MDLVLIRIKCRSAVSPRPSEHANRLASGAVSRNLRSRSDLFAGDQSTNAIMLLLCLACGCVATLPESAWVTDVPQGECTVHVMRGDATGEWQLVHHHAADGRVLSGTTRLRYHGNGWERFVYDEGGALIAIHSYEEIGEEDFPCDAEGGCYTPPRRVVGRTDVEWDESGRLSRTSFETVDYGRRDGSYRQRSGEHHDLRYEYEGGRLSTLRSSTSNGGATTTLHYEGERLTRIVRDARYPRRTAVETDAAGRILRTEYETCTPSYECRVTRVSRYRYDDAGLLVRADYDDPTGDSPSSFATWEYEGGRVVRSRKAEIARDGSEVSVHTFEYDYDELGRIVEVRADDRVRERRRYEGTCDQVGAAPQAPSALADQGVRPCIRSPGYVLDTCTVP